MRWCFSILVFSRYTPKRRIPDWKSWTGSNFDMVSIVNIKEHQGCKKVRISNAPLLSQPLGKKHIGQLHLIFETRHTPKGWCGYSVVDHIPPSFSDFVISVRGRLRLAAILFLNASDDTLLLVRDIQNNFCLLDMDGRLVSRNRKLPLLLMKMPRKALY